MVLQYSGLRNSLLNEKNLFPLLFLVANHMAASMHLGMQAWAGHLPEVQTSHQNGKEHYFK